MAPDTYHRRSIRLKCYDYSSSGAYYVTICTQEGTCLLGSVADGEMLLNSLGKVVQEEWLNTEKVRQDVTVDSFIVMPNHTHAILIIHRNGSLNEPGGCDPPARHPGHLEPASLGAIVGQFKSAAGKRGNELRGKRGEAFWQRNYYERVIRNEQELKAYRQYIMGNPMRWELRLRGIR